MTAQTSTHHIGVNADIKEQATEALSAMGQSASVPNAETRAAMEESRTMMTKHRARFATADELFADLEKSSDH